MRSLFDLLYKKILFLVFIFFVVISASYLFTICTGYLNYGKFDLEEFLLWNKSALSGLIPFRDIFYPYGLLRFYTNTLPFFSFFYFLILPLSLTCLFWVFKKVSRSSIISFLTAICLWILASRVIGFETFTRQAVFLSTSLIFSYLLFKIKKTDLLIFLLGLLISILFTFFSDQGLYILINTLLLIPVKLVSSFKNILSTNYLKELVRKYLLLAAGIFIGILPLVFYIGFEKSYLLLNYLKDVNNISVSVKTPFFAYINSPWNIFTIFITFTFIIYLIIRVFFLKNKINLTNFLQISLIISILVLEQKSIIRSIDRQIIPFSFVLLVLLLNDFLTKTLYKKMNYLLLLITLLFSSFIFINTFSFNNLSISTQNIYKNACFNSNLKSFIAKNTDYTSIYKYLIVQKNFNHKVFSYSPGDSAIYLLLKQKPPHYNAIAEVSSYNAQQEDIDYIKKNKVEYVLLNADPDSMLDGVPDYIRNKLLFKYIITNYFPNKLFGKYLLLKKNTESDFFDSVVLTEASRYRNFLLNINLFMIPYSEGEKGNNFKGTKATSIIYSKKNLNINSNNKFIVLSPSVSLDKNYLLSINIETADNKKTVIYLNSCKKSKQCIIDLSSVPLFYIDRVISHINIDSNFKGKAEIYNLINNSILW